MGIDRRKFIKSIGLGTIMLSAHPFSALSSGIASSEALSSDKAPYADDGPQVQIGDTIAIAETEYGKVKGCLLYTSIKYKPRRYNWQAGCSGL